MTGEEKTMEIPKIMYEKFLKTRESSIELKKALETEFQKNRITQEKNFPKKPSLPLIITEEQHEQIKKSANMFGKIINKTVNFIFEKKITGKYLRMYKTIWDGIKKEKKDSKQDNNIIFSRLNGVFDKKGRIKFFECNQDPNSLLLGEELQKIYKKVTILEQIFNECQILFYDSSKPNLTRFFNRYLREIDFNKTKDKIAITGIEDNCGHKLYARHLDSKGYMTYTVKPDELKLDEKWLTFKGKKIKLLIITDQINRKIMEKLNPAMEAYLSGKVKLIESLRSSIAGEKSLLALITDPRNHKFYNNSEISFIKNHIPWTRIIRHERTTDIYGNNVDLIPYILNNQDRLVLKKSSNFLGEQIGPAFDMNRLDWQTLISWILSDKEYWIAQEKIDFNSSERYVLENDEVNLKKFYWCVNPYMLNGKYQTCYAMTSTSPVVNTETSSIETPVGFIK